MRTDHADFFMGSSEQLSLQTPRRCWRRQRLKSGNRSDDFLVIKVDPAIPGKPFGYADDMDTVIVATRWEGDSLFPINTFPDRQPPVYVCRILIDDIETRTEIEYGDYELFAWAELYPSEAEARARLTYSQARALGRSI